jgi:hypothetical protein
MVEYTDKI